MECLSCFVYSEVQLGSIGISTDTYKTDSRLVRSELCHLINFINFFVHMLCASKALLSPFSSYIGNSLISNVSWLWDSERCISCSAGNTSCLSTDATEVTKVIYIFHLSESIQSC